MSNEETQGAPPQDTRKWVVLSDLYDTHFRGDVIGTADLTASPEASVANGSVREATADEAQHEHVTLSGDDHQGSVDARALFASFQHLIDENVAANPQKQGSYRLPVPLNQEKAPAPPAAPATEPTTSAPTQSAAPISGQPVASPSTETAPPAADETVGGAGAPPDAPTRRLSEAEVDEEALSNG